jgi:flagellin-like hook-associated protein FlgL
MWLFNRLNQLDREQVKIDRQIASGRRDGPISYLISANWLRFDLSGMRVAQDNVNDGIGLIDTTQTNLLSVTDILRDAHDLAVRGANETLTEDEQGKLRHNLYELLGAADETATRARFNGKSLFTGEKVNIQIGPKFEDMYYVRLPYFDLNKFGLSPARPDKSRPTPPHGGHPHLPPKPRPPAPPKPHPHPPPHPLHFPIKEKSLESVEHQSSELIYDANY